MKMKSSLFIIGMLSALSFTSAYADIDYFRLPLPNVSSQTPQDFYCTIKPNHSTNPRILMANHAQMITGFKNPNPNARGQLIMYADQLNRVYFKAYQDPGEKELPGYVQLMGTGETDISCHLGRGEGNRTLMPGDFG
ncbi:MAG: hypothetical protein Q7V63_01945 [Gammaproteobacteria bacterium]|nr:hypothetical protein [Gammaproteobacteria bacterium]